MTLKQLKAKLMEDLKFKEVYEKPETLEDILDGLNQVDDDRMFQCDTGSLKLELKAFIEAKLTAAKIEELKDVSQFTVNESGKSGRNDIINYIDKRIAELEKKGKEQVK